MIDGQYNTTFLDDNRQNITSDRNCLFDCKSSMYICCMIICIFTYLCACVSIIIYAFYIHILLLQAKRVCIPFIYMCVCDRVLCDLYMY